MINFIVSPNSQDVVLALTANIYVHIVFSLNCSDHDEDEMDLVTAGEGELVFDIPCEEGDDAELEGQDDVPFSEMEDLQKRLSVGHAPIVTDAEAVLNDMRCIAFASCLENLINTRVSDMCPVKGCGSKVDPRFTQSGTAMFIDWVSGKANIS